MPEIGTIRCPDPACNSPMVRIRNLNDDSERYECGRYPACRETREIPEYVRMQEIGADQLPGFGS